MFTQPGICTVCDNPDVEVVNKWVMNTFLSSQFQVLKTLLSGDYRLVENNILFLDNEKHTKAERGNKRD